MTFNYWRRPTLIQQIFPISRAQYTYRYRHPVDSASKPDKSEKKEKTPLPKPNNQTRQHKTKKNTKIQKCATGVLSFNEMCTLYIKSCMNLANWSTETGVTSAEKMTSNGPDVQRQ